MKLLFLRIRLSLSFFFLLPTAYSTFAQQNNCTYKGGNVDYLPQINCAKDFDALQSIPLKSSYSNIKSIKVVYDLSGGDIYYTNSKKYRFHFEFCSSYLNAYSNLQEFNEIEYSNSSSRRFAICNVNYYTASNIYTVEFFPDDAIKKADAIKLFNKIKQSSYFTGNLKIANNSWHTQEWQGTTALPLISPDDLYNGQTYQLMTGGTAYGYLRFFADEKTMQKNIQPNDIAVLNELSNNLPLCAATITTVFQTPLCHINILSQNRHTPNGMVKNAFTKSNLIRFKDQLVKVQFLPDSLLITLTTEKEAQQAWDNLRKKKTISLSCNNNYRQLIDVKQLSVKYIDKVGGKAANMGELAKIKIGKNQLLPIPQPVFAIPFYFYNQHLAAHHIDMLITALLNDNTIIYDKPRLAKKLQQIRDSIEQSPLNTELVQLVTQKIGAAKEQNFRFRSSTNAEDVPGFNGAGLYDSKTGNVTSTKKTIDKAIKEVWASLWKQRAFEERLFFNIDQHNLAMGILVNKAFGTEEANGVAITKNLYRNNYPAFTVNVQKGEESIVQPNDNIRAEQFVINLSGDIINVPNELAVDYICHSSLQPNTPVMTKSEVRTLATYLLAIKNHYWKIYGRNRHVDFNNFAMDVEFKLDNTTRKLFIKQARLY